VTGAMLLVAILAFMGQSAKVEFNTSIRDIQSIIQATINDVGTGFYPSGDDIKCELGGNGLSITTDNVEQGSNTDCIFMGKVMQFGALGTDPQQYNILTLAGYKDNNGDITQAKPQIVDIPSATTNAILRNGLNAVSMRYVVGGVSDDIGAVAFVNGLGSYSDSQLISGSQQLSLLPVPDSGKIPNTDKQAVIEAVEDQLVNAPINPSGGVQICFASSGTKQSGLITIGSGGRGLTVKLDIKSTLDCS
jgi:hypothetical protein